MLTYSGLWLAWNMLTGAVPSTITALDALTTLSLENQYVYGLHVLRYVAGSSRCVQNMVEKLHIASLCCVKDGSRCIVDLVACRVVLPLCIDYPLYQWQRERGLCSTDREQRQ